MQRKTNLFYTKSQDSNFLTFSNFTEALTGNFLSTDWKVYPSRFLCLYIPKLDPNNENYDPLNKESFIKYYLVAYYENKLAFLRDYYTKQLTNETNVTEFDIEGDVNAFAWLIKTIEDFVYQGVDMNSYFSIIPEIYEEINHHYTEEEIGSTIWDMSSGYNVRKPHNFSQKMIFCWEEIKGVLKRKQIFFLKFILTKLYS